MCHEQWRLLCHSARALYKLVCLFLSYKSVVFGAYVCVDACFVCSAGSWSCGTCPAGYTGNGRDCFDVNECQLNNGGCAPLAPCINQPGGSSCGSCPSGYTGNGIGANGCTDINECATSSGGCDTRTACSDTPAGSYSCSACPTGFTSVSGDGKTACTAVQTTSSTGSFYDPCAGVTCQNGGSCMNGNCQCTQGFSGTVCQIGPVISNVVLNPVSPGVKSINWASTGSVSTVLIKFFKVGDTIPTTFIPEQA